MKGRWKTFTIIFLIFVKVNCDIMNELLMSVKSLHDKVDQIGKDQVRANEKVEQLQTQLNNLSLDVKKTSVELDDLHETNNITFTELKIDIKNLSFEMSSKLEKIDEANQAILQITGGNKCFASSGNGAAKHCVFPFKYNGITYHGCTKANHDKFWCSTKTTGNGEYISKEWGNCDTNACKGQLCITTSFKNGSKICAFPFNYKGKTYNACTKDHHPKYWCSTKTNSAGEFISEEWAECDIDQCKQ